MHGAGQWHAPAAAQARQLTQADVDAPGRAGTRTVRIPPDGFSGGVEAGVVHPNTGAVGSDGAG